MSVLQTREVDYRRILNIRIISQTYFGLIVMDFFFIKGVFSATGQDIQGKSLSLGSEECINIPCVFLLISLLILILILTLILDCRRLRAGISYGKEIRLSLR